MVCGYIKYTTIRPLKLTPKRSPITRTTIGDTIGVLTKTRIRCRKNSLKLNE